MFDIIRSALLLAVGAVAVDDNCCTLFEEKDYEGVETTLCYDSTVEHMPSYFNLHDHGIEGIGSYKCGASTYYMFCKIHYTWTCRGSIGPVDNWFVDLDPEYKWIKIGHH